MKKNIIKAIYILVCIAVIFLIIKGFTQGKGATEEIADKIIVLEETKILEENEGKLVLLSGKMETDSILEFKEQGVKVNTPILKREIEMYMYKRDDRNLDRVDRDWSKAEPALVEYDEVLNKNFKNPKKEIKNEEKLANVTVGEFIIDSDAIKNLNPNAFVSEFTAIEGLRVVDENVLTTATEKTYKVGDYRMQFPYLDLSETGEYTFIGKQNGNKIEEFSLDTGKKILENFEGNLTKEEVLKEFGTMDNMAIIAGVIIVLALIVVGIFVFKP